MSNMVAIWPSLLFDEIYCTRECFDQVKLRAGPYIRLILPVKRDQAESTVGCVGNNNAYKDVLVQFAPGRMKKKTIEWVCLVNGSCTQLLGPVRARKSRGKNERKIPPTRQRILLCCTWKFVSLNLNLNTEYCT